MKTTRLIPILLLGASLLTACHKQDATTAPPQPVSETGANQGYLYNSKIVYKLTVQKPDPSSLLVWDNGYMHISGIVLNPIYTASGNTTLNTGMSKTDDHRIGQPLDVTMNFFGPTILASVRIPTIYSNQANVTIEAQPKGTAQAFELNGFFNYAPDLPPYPPHHVKFIVSNLINLTTEWVQDPAISPDGAMASMTMDLTQLANGVSYSMLNTAVVTGDTIYITATQNTAIYNVMIANLRSMRLALTLTPSNTTTTSK